VLQPLTLPVTGLAAAYNFNEGKFDGNGTGTGVTLLLDQSGNNLTDTLMGFSTNNLMLFGWKAMPWQCRWCTQPILSQRCVYG